MVVRGADVYRRQAAPEHAPPPKPAPSPKPRGPPPAPDLNWEVSMKVPLDHPPNLSHNLNLTGDKRIKRRDRKEGKNIKGRAGKRL